MTLFSVPEIRGALQETDEDITFQFSECGGSLNGPDLFTELPFP